MLVEGLPVFLWSTQPLYKSSTRQPPSMLPIKFSRIFVANCPSGGSERRGKPQPKTTALLRSAPLPLFRSVPPRPPRSAPPLGMMNLPAMMYPIYDPREAIIRIRPLGVLTSQLRYARAMIRVSYDPKSRPRGDKPACYDTSKL